MRTGGRRDGQVAAHGEIAPEPRGLLEASGGDGGAGVQQFGGDVLDVALVALLGAARRIALHCLAEDGQRGEEQRWRHGRRVAQQLQQRRPTLDQLRSVHRLWDSASSKFKSYAIAHSEPSWMNHEDGHPRGDPSAKPVEPNN